MAWPLASQFSAMLQRPELAFRDPALKRYAIEKDRFRQPRPWAGSFAVVYKGTPPDGGPPRAFRVFTSESPERRERYDAISEHLASRRVSGLVPFEYRDDSVRAAGDGRWFPLIVMEWVQGETLFKWAAARARAGDRDALAAAAARWTDLVEELELADVAHGDFQHANVLVAADGSLKLVDYDGMCVPALVGRRNLEVGVEPYQHPQRDAQTSLSLRLDRYSALVVYVALRALAADPALWGEHVDRPQHDKLLFRKDDFLAPDASPLLRDLRDSPDRDLPDLVEQLLELAAGPIDEVPPLRQTSQPSFRQIERLLSGQRWNDAVAALNRRGRFRDAPRHLRPLIEQAYRHVCRGEAWEAFQRVTPVVAERFDRELTKAWNESLFAGFEPAEQARARVEAARDRLAAVDRVEQVVREVGPNVRREGEARLAELAPLFPPHYHHARAERLALARRRTAALTMLEAALAVDEEAAVVVATWREIAQAGVDELVADEARRRVELAQRRLPALEALRRIPEHLPLDQKDIQLLQAWDDELLADCREVDGWRDAHAEALERRQRLADLERAARAGDDDETARLADLGLWSGYVHAQGLADEIAAARARLERTRVLVEALRRGDREAFRAAFDIRLVRRHRQRFAPFESALCEGTRSEMLPFERLGLRPAVGRASLVCEDRGRGVYRVRWTWPQPRYADECVLAVSADEPRPGDDPDQLAAFYRLRLDREGWERAGGSRLLNALPEWAGGHVAVWALVDLGFRCLASHPLVLGRIDSRRGLGGFWRRLRPAEGRP